MIARLKNRWLKPRVLGVLVAKLILSSATSLAAQTTVCPSTNFSTTRAELTQAIIVPPDFSPFKANL